VKEPQHQTRVKDRYYSNGLFFTICYSANLPDLPHFQGLPLRFPQLLSVILELVFEFLLRQAFCFSSFLTRNIQLHCAGQASPRSLNSLNFLEGLMVWILSHLHSVDESFEGLFQSRNVVGLWDVLLRFRVLTNMLKIPLIESLSDVWEKVN